MRKIDTIIVHCSDSSFGDASDIDKWHKERGWKKIGYHYVILNGARDKGVVEPTLDGRVEEGRPLNEVGSHVAGHNTTSIGICLISEGKGLPTPPQFAALALLVADLRRRFSIPIESVFGHNQFSSKACPGFDITVLRNVLRQF